MTGAVLGAASVPPAPSASDVFSSNLATGNGSSQSIASVDLSGGGLVWGKSRSASGDNILVDSGRGVTKPIFTNSDSAQTTDATVVTALTSTGFSLGGGGLNTGSTTYAYWSFAKRARFFDVVTWTGTGGSRVIGHDLKTNVGMIFARRVDATDDWHGYHRSVGATKSFKINGNASAVVSSDWNNAAPDAGTFSVGSALNSSGGSYVAYIWAHDPSGVVHAGAYTGNGISGRQVNDLLWKPQFLFYTSQSGQSSNALIDSSRNFDTTGTEGNLYTNQSSAETSFDFVDAISNGFQLNSNSYPNSSGIEYMYMAIRS